MYVYMHCVYALIDVAFITSQERDNVVYWKTKRKIKNDLKK